MDIKDYTLSSFKNITEIEELQSDINDERKRALIQRRKIRKLKKAILEAEEEQEKQIAKMDEQLATLDNLYQQFSKEIVTDGNS